MNRVDIGWQARWEMLKIRIAELRKEAVRRGKGYLYEEIHDIMADLEKVHEPILARPIEEYRSPMDGQRRSVFEPIPVIEVAMERATMRGDILGSGMPPCKKCGSTKFTTELEYEAEFEKEEVDGARIVKRIGKLLGSTVACKNCQDKLASNLPVHGLNEEEMCDAMRAGAGLTTKPGLSVTEDTK